MPSPVEQDPVSSGKPLAKPLPQRDRVSVAHEILVILNEPMRAEHARDLGYLTSDPRQWREVLIVGVQHNNSEHPVLLD